MFSILLKFGKSKRIGLEAAWSIKNESGNDVFNVKHDLFSIVYEFIDCRVDEVVGQIKEELNVFGIGMPKFVIFIGEFEFWNI